MIYKKQELYLTTRNSIYYFVRRVPRDLIQYYYYNRYKIALLLMTLNQDERDLNYSKQFDVQTWSDYPEVNEFVYYICGNYYKPNDRVDSVELEELTALYDWVNSLEEYHTLL